MYVVCLDLESVLIPEIWVVLAEATGISELRLTTRDVPDYEALMKQRLQILSAHNLTLRDIQKIIESIKPLSGGLPFLTWLRKHFPVIILTDSFCEFIAPLAKRLAYPTVFSNSLEVDKRGFICNYRLQRHNGKGEVLRAFKGLKFQTIAIGDSYNDINMLQEADVGILFKPNGNILEEFPSIPRANSYSELKNILTKYTIS